MCVLCLRVSLFCINWFIFFMLWCECVWGNYVRCALMVSKILFVGVTVRSSFKWMPLRASLYMWNFSIVFKCLPFF
jgi:hypothetical protein